LQLSIAKRNPRPIRRLSVRPLALCLILLAFTSACETTTDSIFGIGGGGGAVTQAQVAGNWTFTLTRTTTLACTGGALTDGQVITAHIDVGSDGTLNSTTSSWENPPSTFVRPLSGAVRFTDGVTDLVLTSSAGSNSAMELRGTVSSNTTFSGTLTDPAAGFSPMFGTSGCEYTATGTKG
jgi:hypothetical protein